MTMKFRMFKHMMKQGLTGMWRNRMMSLASIGSVTSALFILGIVLILILNINNMTNMAQEKFDEIHVFLVDDLTDENVDSIGDKISEYEGVLSVTFRSREQALEIMKKDWGDESYLLEGLEDNPFPNSYIIQLSSIDKADAVVQKLQAVSGIEGIRFHQDIVEKMMTITNFVRMSGLIIITILTLISIFIISNTIKLTVSARKREINIMKYVGATNGFIRGPFIIEGTLLGVIGSALAIAIVSFGYKYIFNVASEKLYVFFTMYMIPFDGLFEDIIIIFSVIGIGIGILGSVISLRKFLRV